jgi:hypothetical protein
MRTMRNGTRRAKHWARIATVSALACPSAVGAARRAPVEGVPVQIVSDAGDETYQVVVRDRDRAVAVCATPCPLRLPVGNYAAEAHSNAHTFVVRFRTTASGQGVRVRLGMRNALRHWTGFTLAAVGLSAGAVAFDHWRYLVLEGIGEPTQPWVAQWLPAVRGDLALATSVAFVPIAAVLLVPAFHLLTEPQVSAVAERVTPRTYRRWNGLRVSQMRFEFVQGGGMVGATVTF